MTSSCTVFSCKSYYSIENKENQPVPEGRGRLPPGQPVEPRYGYLCAIFFFSFYFFFLCLSVCLAGAAGKGGTAVLGSEAVSRSQH